MADASKAWEELADWYDKKQGETGDVWHRALIDPPLLKIVGDCRGKDLLDLGCGNGYISRKLAAEGARVTAIDSSQKMIQNSQAHDPGNKCGIRYARADASHLDMINDSSFDLVIANMSLMDIEDAEGAIRETGRVLRKKGRFIASISHPCFDTGTQSGWVVDKWQFEPPKVSRKVRAYRVPFSEQIPWRVESGERKHTIAFHRPLSWYARALRNSGLFITALEEPMPTDEFLEWENQKGGDIDAKGFLEVPLHLIFEAVKM